MKFLGILQGLIKGIAEAVQAEILSGLVACS
jgi:hypothetical protein